MNSPHPMPFSDWIRNPLSTPHLSILYSGNSAWKAIGDICPCFGGPRPSAPPTMCGLPYQVFPDQVVLLQISSLSLPRLLVNYTGKLLPGSLQGRQWQGQYLSLSRILALSRDERRVERECSCITSSALSWLRGQNRIPLNFHMK